MITPAGDGVEATWNRVCEGLPTATPDPALAGLPVDFSCRLPADVDGNRAVGRRDAWRMSRVTKVAVAAARDAVGDAGHDPETWESRRVAVVMGCGVGDLALWADQAHRLRDKGPGSVSATSMPRALANMPAGEVALALGARGPSMAAVTACASGATALATARRLLQLGLCDIAVAGGVEMAIAPLPVTAFHQMGALSVRRDDVAGASRPFAATRDGFVMGEGAAVLVLERAEDAAARGGRARAVLAGSGETTDAHHPTTPRPDGLGSEEALRLALEDAGLAPGDVDHVNAHATSTPAGDAAEATMIARFLPHAPSVTAVKGVLGHTLGAAGAIEAALTVLSVERGIAPPIANLTDDTVEFDLDCVTKTSRTQRIRTAVTNSFGFGGHNVVLVLTSGATR
ncbi:beta-ketoacyl-[acyl-carrier-protein] synthase family protein [Streptomyces sp. Ju416(a)]|uniref:beta-ketoacyl-[acyl-carrier-protein] synthase family protein n=1 Tax=unclassified Streptomyces TaxID=2593676 RepID=UPI000D50EEA1|nr:beta-ketoacyl-[acyl-carrier-protein] synthase family protein [Streptomyces sp. CS014]PVC80850.1 3-oxoacyl-ACP synthase [Streptomyces sp. CS014]